MNTQFKRKSSKEQKQTNGNINYINFIKKNHNLMHQNANDHNSYRYSQQNQREDSPIYHTINTPRDQQYDIYAQNKSGVDKAIHNSLSKFRVSGADSQKNNGFSNAGLQQSYGTNSNKHNSVFNTIQNKGQRAAMIASTKTKLAKHQAAKQMLLNMYKNRSSSDHHKNYSQKQNYQFYDSPSNLHLKFPLIEKKNLAAFIVNTPETDSILNNDLKQKSKLLEVKQDILNINGHGLLSEKQEDDKRKKQQRNTLQSKFKMREELYGLLPVFRTPALNFDGRKNKFLTGSKSKGKIEKINHPPLKEMLEDYLQQNIVMKSMIIPFAKIKSKEKQTPIQKDLTQPISSNNCSQIKIVLQPKSQEVMEQQKVLSITNELESTDGTNKEVEQKIKIKKQQKQKSGVVQLRYDDGQLTVYDLKIRSYRQFLFMVNLAHRVFDPLLLKEPSSCKPQNRYKFYLGKGNNYLLVKSLLKRRFWWTAEDDYKKANFVWTQLKQNNFYQYQKKAEIQKKHYKLDQDYEMVESPKKKKNKQLVQTKQPTKAGIFRAPFPQNDKKIFTNCDKKYYDEFLDKAENPSKLLKFSNRLKYFEEGFLKNKSQDISSQRMHNHLEFNYFIGNKKALFYNIKQYYDLQKKNVFEIIPLTYHIKHGTTDSQYELFTKEFKRLAKEKSTKNNVKNIWIVKPGQLSNRGQGITVIDQIYELNNILKKKEKHFNGIEKTYIVQKYIQKPLLYKNRKFDIRHYMMISRLHGVMRAYWFGEGYIRTSSFQFNIEDIGDEVIHLTNDAIQKYCQGYGKHEEGNKVSYNEFQRYMESTYGEGKFNFSEMIYPKMKAIALDAVKATYLQLDTNNTEHNFQVFGLDFMIDTNYDVWLIEVNTNPCLELSSKLLGRIIPTMIQHTFRLTIDTIFPPPTHYPNSQKYLAPDNPLDRLQFELIFDENRDGKQIEELYANSKKVDMGEVDQEQQTYENDGKQIQLQNQIQ